MINEFSGVIPPIVTPFTHDGTKISEVNFRKIIRYILDNGCSGVFTSGSQGEFFSLTNKERIEALEIAVDESAGKTPVLAGTATISTIESVKLSIEAEKKGAAGISVINPFFITLNEEEIYQYFATIAKSVNIPMFLYNNPARTAAAIPLNVVKRLAEIDNIVGMKDSSGDLTYVNSIITSTDNFKIFCGRDTCIFSELSVGATGAVAATANVAPRLVSSIVKEYKLGNLAKARQLQADLIPLRDSFSLGSFPVVVKEALQLIGIDAGPARLPVMPMSDENRKKLKNILTTMNLI
ncbi:MAG: 4-hydroxy-tetrahydrodipicolinate synthase [Sphaerochaetaceae bacterium]|nr:4-hydroxy-tetrahydrodipicolinate synthase [Sphaerochaetaceae bacterium]